MSYPSAYIDFLVHFHGDRDYFECHEILEEYWKIVDNGNKSSLWVGLIQLAVANYHHRRGNFSGAHRTMEKALTILNHYQAQLNQLGMNARELLDQIEEHLSNIQKRKEYKSVNLPISSKNLQKLCTQRSQELSLNWQQESDLSDIEIIHRHKRRDRSDIIKERDQALLKKNRRK